jgi:hypothetical protein
MERLIHTIVLIDLSLSSASEPPFCPLSLSSNDDSVLFIFELTLVSKRNPSSVAIVSPITYVQDLRFYPPRDPSAFHILFHFKK